MAELRISDVPGVLGGRRRVEVMWQDRAARRVAVAEFAAPSDAREGERFRWYLEDYAELPADPAPAIARTAEAQLAQTGAELFRAVFADVDAMGIWERARDRLGLVRVEVEADPGEGPGIPWELLRDPGSDAPLARARAGCLPSASSSGSRPGRGRTPGRLPKPRSALAPVLVPAELTHEQLRKGQGLQRVPPQRVGALHVEHYAHQIEEVEAGLANLKNMAGTAQ